jgi:hypothetical protein
MTTLLSCPYCDKPITITAQKSGRPAIVKKKPVKKAHMKTPATKRKK